MQGVSSSKIAHRTIFEFTSCGAPDGTGISPSADGDKGAASRQTVRRTVYTIFLRERRQRMAAPFSKVTVVTVTLGPKKPVIILLNYKER